MVNGSLAYINTTNMFYTQFVLKIKLKRHCRLVSLVALLKVRKTSAPFPCWIHPSTPGAYHTLWLGTNLLPNLTGTKLSWNFPHCSTWSVCCIPKGDNSWRCCSPYLRFAGTAVTMLNCVRVSIVFCLLKEFKNKWKYIKIIPTLPFLSALFVYGFHPHFTSTLNWI